jgi:predicted transcriptional regulator
MSNVLKRLMGLNNLEVRVFEIVKGVDVRAEHIADKVQRAISSVNRAINTLIKVGLVSRESRCCDKKRGRYFVYSLSPKFKQVLEKRLNDFSREMKMEIVDL